MRAVFYSNININIFPASTYIAFAFSHVKQFKEPFNLAIETEEANSYCDSLLWPGQ